MKKMTILLVLVIASLSLLNAQTDDQKGPKVKAAVAPSYPGLAVTASAFGIVRVRVIVNGPGTVTRAEVIEGHPMLRQAAIDAAQKWKFDTGSQEQRSVVLQFDFVLLPASAKMESQTTFLPPYRIEVEKRSPEPTVTTPSGK
jgi:TonB family protein